MGLLDQNNYAGYAQEGQRLAVEPMSFTPMDAARFVAEATPIIGDAMAAKEVYDELQKPDPNYAMVAALGGAALVGLVPGLGDAMASGIKKGARGLLDTAKRIEVDPSIVGSMGGNLKVRRDIPNEMRDNQVLVRIPVKDVEHGESAMFGGKLTLPGSRKLIEEYSQKDTKIPPIEIMSYEDGLAMIADGSHRFEAAKLRGQDYIEAYVNKDDFLDLPSAEVIQPSLSLPAPRNEAEAMAKKVLEMRASGNARDVTEKMMAAADDQYMFKNTPIPMDAASRKARATDDNFVPALHGTGDDISAVDASFFGSGQDLLGSGFYTTTGPARADRYVPREKTPSIQVSKEYAEGGNILPLMVREDRPFILEDVVGDSAKEIADIYSQDPYFDVSEMSSGVRIISTDDGGSVMLDPYQQKHHALQNMRGAYGASLTSDVLSDAGYSGVSGPEALGNRVRVAYKPEDVRSQFARFDPEFKHLKNLTAAGLLAPGVLAAMQEYKKQQELERGLLSY